MSKAGLDILSSYPIYKLINILESQLNNPLSAILDYLRMKNSEVLETSSMGIQLGPIGRSWDHLFAAIYICKLFTYIRITHYHVCLRMHHIGEAPLEGGGIRPRVVATDSNFQVKIG